MSEKPILIDQAITVDGAVIGFVRSIRNCLFCARTVDQPLNQTCFETYNEAWDFLLQPYSIKSEKGTTR